MQQVQLSIGGADRDAQDGKTFERVNPVSGKAVTRAAAASVSDARAAADAAAAAFPAWSALGPGERRTKLLAAADKLDSYAERFAVTMTEETGATMPWGMFNVHLAADMLREAAALVTSITGETLPSDVPGSFALSVRQPVGVVLGIAPWNAPVILGVRAIAAPLACGNTVILKASETCPATHRLIGTALVEAGLGAGVVNVVTHDARDAQPIVEALIAHPAVRRVNFTGSTRVGKIIAKLAAEHLKPALLELGGKAPLLILEDADLDEATNAIVFGGFANQGQICMSTERVLVCDAVADALAEKVAARIKSLPWGDPTRNDVVLGSLVSTAAAEHVETLVRDAASRGAKVLAGGERKGSVMAGLVVDRVTPEMKLFTEESFGPVVAITRAPDAQSLLKLANSSEYGLSASIFTRDVSRGIALAKQLESGICHINGPTVHDEAHMPFGGVKGSGYGRFGGKAAIAEFTELRWITVQTTPRKYPF
ncbi:MAG TPA: aldehyde dehydrogenase [Polyangiales bacterium]|nr:aldehyde dehydrogenase [Polyangiales bacterium]